MAQRRHNLRDPRTGRFISVVEAVERRATKRPFHGTLPETTAAEAEASLRDVREIWLEETTDLLIDELTTGDHVHVISGDLKAGFYSIEPGFIMNDVPYAVNEFTRPGVREFGDIREGDEGSATPHNPFPSAWEAILPEVQGIMETAVEKNLKLPTLRINAAVIVEANQGEPIVERRMFGTSPRVS